MTWWQWALAYPIGGFTFGAVIAIMVTTLGCDRPIRKYWRQDLPYWLFLAGAVCVFALVSSMMEGAE